MHNLLEVTGLNAGYGQGQVLDAINLNVPARGITCVLGANGAGKTTILRAICGMCNVTGSVKLNGEEIVDLPTENIVRRGVAHVPDGRGTFTGLTVEENLQLGTFGRRDKAGIKRDFERVYQYFPKLLSRRRQQAGTLSGGEQQMLAISRALMLQPSLMLLDEPSFGLAPIIVKEIFEIMRVINKEEGVGLLLVEQNAQLALKLADQAFLIETGRTVMSGAADEIAGNEDVRKVYLGY